MIRVPKSTSLEALLGPSIDLVSTASQAEQLAFLVDMDRQFAYQWTTHDDEIADDAITVGLDGTSTEMLAAGLTYVEPTASIYWRGRVTGRGVFPDGSEMGPWAVVEALRRAHELRILMGYERVVVTMAEVGIWRPEYGRLADREGF